MKSLYTCVLLLLVTLAKAQDKVYHWSSEEGVVNEIGGSISQQNSTVVNRINMECSGYYVIGILGMKEWMDSDTKSEKAQYMKVTLNVGETFKAGDVLRITGMRNCTTTTANATLFMKFDNGTIIKDENAWNNLGQLYEVTIEGGTSHAPRKANSGNEDFTAISAFPSTYEYVIPQEADGSTELYLTRDVSECRLYIVEINVERQVANIVNKYGSEKENQHAYNLQGVRMSKPQKGINIIGRKKVLINN